VSAVHSVGLRAEKRVPTKTTRIAMLMSRTCWNTLFFLLSVLSHCSCPLRHDRKWWHWLRRSITKQPLPPGQNPCLALLSAPSRLISMPGVSHQIGGCFCSCRKGR
jgi:hypothetical protein